MASIAPERTVGPTKRAVLNGLSAFNTERMGKQRFKQLAVSLKDRCKVVGAIEGYPGGVTRHWFTKAL